LDHDELQQLLRPDAFPHSVGEVLLRETHISWVTLAGERAYKIKKPLDLGFLDFSSLDKRRHYCEQEAALNRRFAPEIYLGVVPVTRGAEGLEFGGRGEVIDYAVEMRRFDDDQLLSAIAARGGLDHSLVRELAAELARLHRELPVCRPDPDGDEPGTPRALAAAMAQNFAQVRAFGLTDKDRGELDAVEQWFDRRYHELLPLLRQRLHDGCVIDGHGDAHLGNIAVVDGRVRLFDCIEFNAAFRIMDRIAEVAFLAMDMAARGHADGAHRLLTDYLEYSGDFAALPLFDLYRCYYALVRAKVNLLRESPANAALRQTDAYREFTRYLSLAVAYGRPRQSLLAITYGVSGTGKSTVAGKLVAAGGLVRLRSDVERKRLFGLLPEQRSVASDLALLYSRDMTRRTFARLEQLAAEVVAAGFGVIVDATFLDRATRDRFAALAQALAVPFLIVECVASEQQLRARLQRREQRRDDASDAGVAIMERQLAIREPLAAGEKVRSVSVSSEEDGVAVWRRLLALSAVVDRN